MTIKEILERLVTARERAGLSAGQVAKMVNLSSPEMKLVESGEIALEMVLFLKLCEIYEVSEIWVLTGVNPYFDPAGAVAAAQKLGMPENEMRNFLEALAMQRQLQ